MPRRKLTLRYVNFCICQSKPVLVIADFYMPQIKLPEATVNFCIYQSKLVLVVADICMPYPKLWMVVADFSRSCRKVQTVMVAGAMAGIVSRWTQTCAGNSLSK